MKLRFEPLSGQNWPAFEKLFGDRGACGGCWCMTPRLKSSDYARMKGEGNKKAMHEIARSGAPAGVLAFSGDEAVGWCAVAPRTAFVRLQNSRILKPVDDQPVWSVTCLFIDKSWRRKGLSVKLLDAAAEFARANGATIVEGYPVIPQQKAMPDVFAYTGIATAYEKAGFKEVARRSATRPVMRRQL